MNDILILNNGVRFENYQYSSHHPLGIDEFGVEDVEIIKGPASLLYGSDAIGGVVNFIKEKPASIGSVSGDYNLQTFSNSQGITNNLGVKAALKKWFGGIRAGQKSNADYLEGDGRFVPNSRFSESSVKANAGFTDALGTFKIFYDYNNQKLGLVEDEAVESITERGRRPEILFQELNTHLLSSQNKFFLGQFKLDLNAAFQNTEVAHQEDADTCEIQMNLATLTYEAKLYLPSGPASEYIAGIQGFNQENSNLNDREVVLLPDAQTNNFSVFGLLQKTFFSKLKLQSGLRFDSKTIATVAVGVPSDIGPHSINRIKVSVARLARLFTPPKNCCFGQIWRLLTAHPIWPNLPRMGLMNCDLKWATPIFCPRMQSRQMLVCITTTIRLRLMLPVFTILSATLFLSH
jgi:iron complex outermembrane receptor protein